MPTAPVRIIFGKKIPAAIATPEPLSAVPTYASWVTIIASRGRVVNTSAVYLGGSATNDAQEFPLAAGTVLEIEAGEDGTVDLSQIYVDAVTLGDGVQFVYAQAARY